MRVPAYSQKLRSLSACLGKDGGPAAKTAQRRALTSEDERALL